MIKVVVHSYYLEDVRVRKQCEELAKYGFEVEVICLNRGGESQHEIVNGVQIKRAQVSRTKTKRTKFKYVCEYLFFFISALFKLGLSKDELVIIHNMPNFLVFAAIFKKLRKVPVVLDVHDLMPEIWTMIDNRNKGWLYRVLLLEEKISHYFADHLITVNHSVAKYLADRTNMRYEVFHNGPLHASMSTKTLSKFKSHLYNLVYHGNIHERYGLQRLIKILPSLKTTFPKITLDIYGYGPYLDDIIKLVDKLGIGDYCFIHGRFIPDLLPEILRNKGLGFVVADKTIQHDLAIPVKLTEYVDNNVGVICTELDGVKKYFPSGITFFNVQEEGSLEEKVIVALENSEKLYESILISKQNLNKISWNLEKIHYINFIKKATDS